MIKSKRDPWWQPTREEIDAAIAFALKLQRDGFGWKDLDPGPNAKIPPGGIHP